MGRINGIICWARWAETQLLANGLGDAGLLGDALPLFERVLIDATLAHTAGRKRDAADVAGLGTKHPNPEKCRNSIWTARVRKTDKTIAKQGPKSC